MRFETAIPLGKGATGEVFEAWDPRLQRKVALKLLRRDDPDSVERMLREAQAQARVDHPNVCRIFDVGESDGRPYISMQLVSGVPLDEAMADLGIEPRVALIRTVADAVQAAHAAGLVHRDLKPANILVETREDGALVPVVLDFGIAREATADGLTMTGQLVGTPAYMSPEQARGETRTLDRRSDVFSLGVLLYEALSGRHPFADESMMRTLVRVTEEEPTPLRRVAPHVPPDLAGIVEKCLEKAPDRRYRSARALVEDLDRFLAGEPVEARAAGWTDRLLKRIRRHPVTTAVVGTAAVLVLAATGFALHARWTAREEAQIAQRFGERVERIDHLMRLARLSPLHDTTNDQALVEAEMRAIEESMRVSGERAAGPGHAALGRAMLSLDRPEEARGHLERALEIGFAGNAVRLALAEALVSLHHRELAALDRLEDRALREAERARLDLELAIPARRLLLESRQADLAEHEQAWVEGLLALESGDFEEAVARGTAASRARSWFFEGDLLAGEARLREARNRLVAGDLAAARELASSAANPLRRAKATAPSAVAAHMATCRLRRLETEIELAAGRFPETALRATLSGCDEGLRADPAQTDLLLEAAEISWVTGRSAVRHGRDPERYLAETRRRVERSLRIEPESPEAFTHLGNAELVRAERRMNLGEDPLPSFEAAIENLRRSLALEPGDALASLGLGDTLSRLGLWQMNTGRDPIERFQEALAVYRRGATDAGFLGARFQNAICYTETNLGYHWILHGENPGDHLENATAACRKALDVSPNHLEARKNLGVAEWTRAEVLRNSGRDVTDHYRAAVEAFRQVLALDPDNSAASVNLAHVLIDLAAERVPEGEEEFLAPAAGLLHEIRDVYPDDFHFLSAKLHLVRAANAGSAPAASAAFTAAKEHAGASVAIHEDRTDQLTLLARVHREEAEWLAVRGREAAAEEAVREGLRAVDRALSIDPKRPEALIHLAALAYLGARLGVEIPAGTEGHLAGIRPALAARRDLAEDLPPEVIARVTSVTAKDPAHP